MATLVAHLVNVFLKNRWRDIEQSFDFILIMSFKCYVSAYKLNIIENIFYIFRSVVTTSLLL